MNHPKLKDPLLFDAVPDCVAVTTLNVESNIMRGSRSVESGEILPYIVDVLPQVQPRSWEFLSFIRFKPRGRAYFRLGTYSWRDGTRELLDIDVVKRLSKG